MLWFGFGTWKVGVVLAWGDCTATWLLAGRSTEVHMLKLVLKLLS